MKLSRLLAVSALALASCASYEFRRQDVAFRHDPETDTLELIAVSHGLLSSVSQSAAVAKADAGGARHVILFGWPFEFDLDDVEERLRAKDDLEPLAARTLAWTPGIAVDEAAMWCGDGGELSLYQRLTVPRASEGVLLLNDAINAECLRLESWKSIARDTDARTGELWEQHVRAGRPWVELRDGGVLVHLPVGPAGAARFLEEALRQSADGLLPLAEALTSLRVADGVATLAFQPDRTGWVRLRLEQEVKDGAEALVPAEGTPLHPAPVDVLRLLELPRRPDAAEGPSAEEGR